MLFLRSTNTSQTRSPIVMGDYYNLFDFRREVVHLDKAFRYPVQNEILQQTLFLKCTTLYFCIYVLHEYTTRVENYNNFKTMSS
jgi:hypothetical protein